MASAKSAPRLNEAEYLEIERRAEYKSEFLRGEMFAMSGGTRWHSLIAVNLAGELRARLKGSRCMVLNSDMRVKIEAAGLYTYPDLSIACESEQFVDDQGDTLLNPTVIIEVLSDSREAYDRGQKFEFYRQIPSLREYVLVSQDRPHLEQFVRQPSGDWLFHDVSGLDAQITLPSIGVSVALAEIFAKVQFPPLSPRPDKSTSA